MSTIGKVLIFSPEFRLDWAAEACFNHIKYDSSIYSEVKYQNFTESKLRKPQKEFKMLPQIG